LRVALASFSFLTILALACSVECYHAGSPTALAGPLSMLLTLVSA
jgi:hypothetical protein